MNRFYPLAFGVNAFDDVSTTFYLMYQSKRAGVSDSWNEAYVGGVSISF